MQQGKADALSRRSYMELRPRELAFEHKKQVLLGPNRLRLMAANALTTLEDSTLPDSIRDLMATDEFANDVWIISSQIVLLARSRKTLVMTIVNSIGMVGFCFDKTYCMFLIVRHDYKSYNFAMTHQWLNILEFAKV